MGAILEMPSLALRLRTLRKSIVVFLNGGVMPENSEPNRDEKVPERLSDYRNLHYPIDCGFCSCGVFCETGTRFRQHLQDVALTR